MSAPANFRSSQIVLHWLTMLLVGFQLIFHGGIDDAFQYGINTGRMVVLSPVIIHFAVGATIFALVIARLVLRNFYGAPDAPSSEPPVARRASRWAHRAFYVVLLAMPVTGALAWLRASAGFGLAHEALKAFLILLIFAHIGAVLVHQFYWKTNLLKRMVPFLR